MSLNRFRNELCPCGSGKKFKYCCLQNHTRQLRQIMTPIQKAEGKKTAAYWRKRYRCVTSKDLEVPMMMGKRQYEN